MTRVSTRFCFALSVADASGRFARPRNHETMLIWRLLSPPVASRLVLAMQKVEGSSPFIRLGVEPNLP